MFFGQKSDFHFHSFCKQKSNIRVWCVKGLFWGLLAQKGRILLNLPLLLGLETFKTETKRDRPYRGSYTSRYYTPKLFRLKLTTLGPASISRPSKIRTSTGWRTTCAFLSASGWTGGWRKCPSSSPSTKSTSCGKSSKGLGRGRRGTI